MNDQLAIYPSLKNKTVYVTGGASGIGKEIVIAFAAQGSKIGFVDFDQKSGEALAAAYENVHFEAADLRDIDGLKLSFENLKKRIGAAEVLVNNAARDDRHDWKDVTSEYWDERMATNIKHMFFAMQAVAPDMIKAGSGSIVNMSSNSWLESVGGFPAYATAKAAVHGLTRTMARDIGQHRIRANIVVPGWIMTDRQKELWVTPEKLAAHLEGQCLPDPIDPIHVARMVLFLASDDSQMCTGGEFRVDAGSI